MIMAMGGSAGQAVIDAKRRTKMGLRAAILLCTLAACGLILRGGMANWLSRSDPATAAVIAPGNAEITMAAARARIDAGEKAQDPAVRALVGAALARDVTMTPAIELSALETEATGNEARAARLFELSGKISRRSLATRLWLIQRSVDHGDVAGALQNFDIALRTSSAAPAVLFPVLTAATADPTLVEPIARALDRPGDWRVMFLQYAIHQGGAAPNIAHVVLAMRDHAAITGNGIDDLLIAQLVTDRAFEEAEHVRNVFGQPARTGALVADGNFADPSARYPFGWGMTAKGDLEALRGPEQGRPVLAYRAVAGRAGQVAAQLLFLPPGTYRLAARTATAGDPGALPYWTLTCAEQGGAGIATLDQPSRKDGSATADFRVPDGCPAQWITFTLRPSDLPQGQSGAVAQIRIAPAQGGGGSSTN
jgi:hypothetical protein